MKALFKSINLIGDGLYISTPLQAWHKKNPDAEITILTLKDHITELYEGMGVPCNIVHMADESAYDFVFNFDCGQAFMIGDRDKCHIAEAYAKMLGVEIETAGPVYEAPLYMVPMGMIYVAPFSRSCSSHEGKPPNKMLPFDKWAILLRYLRTLGPIELLGGPNDVWPSSPDPVMRFSEFEKVFGLSLGEVARRLKFAKLLVTVDNGIGHLAASQQTPTVVFYPECLGIHWITPVGNPNAVAIQINPATVAPVLLLKKLKEVIEFDLKKAVHGG